MATGEELLRQATMLLGMDKRLEAERMLAAVLGCNRAHLLAHDREALADSQAQTFRQWVKRRADGEPLQYILGSTAFMGMDFLVTKDVLIPRFDTEILVEQAIKCLHGAKAPHPILDVCTGSGAIAISLAKYVQDSMVWASDLSPQALAVAEKNGQRLQVTVNFRQGDLLKPFTEAAFSAYFQLIVSNPPYITTAEMADLPIEVQKEPVMALWGGSDGLDFYRHLAAESPALLADGGWLALEIGFQQGKSVQKLLENAGFQEISIVQDWQGHDRVVLGKWYRKL